MSEHQGHPAGELLKKASESQVHVYPTPGKYEILTSGDKKFKLIAGINPKEPTKWENVFKTKVMFESIPRSMVDNAVGCFLDTSGKLDWLRRIMLLAEPSIVSVTVDITANEPEQKLYAFAHIDVAKEHRKKGIGSVALEQHDNLIILASQMSGYSGYKANISFTDISSKETGYNWSTKNMERVGLVGYQPLEHLTKKQGKPHFSKHIVIP